MDLQLDPNLLAGLVTGLPQVPGAAPKIQGFTITTPQGVELDGEVAGAQLDLIATAPSEEVLQLGLFLQLMMAERMGCKVERTLADPATT